MFSSQDLGQLVRKYEKQYEQLINRSKQQHDRINTLQKDNVNMHREHNRLQVPLKNISITRFVYFFSVILFSR